MFPSILVALSAVTHLLYFGWPKAVVFDEVYFATFVGDYSTGSYYFDIHPPLAKLIAKFFGDVVGATYNVDMTAIGNVIPDGVMLLRLIPIFAGILLPLVIYYICKELKFSKLASFAAGLLIIFENSLLVQSRFILFDSIMLLFGFCAILCYLIYIRKGKSSYLVYSALLCAGAFSIKWTGLAYPLLIALAEMYRTKKIREILKIGILYFVVGLFIYLSSFAIHFAYLPNAGPGDDFMTDRFKKTLIGDYYYDKPDIQPKGFFGKTIELNVQMYEANHNLKDKHTYSSPWYTWPFMLRPVFYWQGTYTNLGNEYIYLLGNPLIYWLGTISIVVLLWQVVIKKLRDHAALLILVGFFVNFLPFIFIGRVMFIYHYEAALVFSIMAILYVVERHVRIDRQKKAIWAILIASFALFIFFAPLSYGLNLSDAALHLRMWLPTWR